MSFNLHEWTSSAKTNWRKPQTKTFKQCQRLTRGQNNVFRSFLCQILVVQYSDVILRYFLPTRLFHVIDWHTEHNIVPSLHFWSTTTTTTTVFRPFVRDYPDEPVPEETFTHSPILIIIQPLSASSIYYDPQHLPCSIYGLDNLFAQPLSKSSLVYLLVWSPSPHIPYISSPNQHLFATNAHIIAACFAVVPRLYHLLLVSLSTLYLGFYLLP